MCGSLRLLVGGDGGHWTDFTSWISPGEYGARGCVDYEPVLFRALRFVALTRSQGSQLLSHHPSSLRPLLYLSGASAQGPPAGR